MRISDWSSDVCSSDLDDPEIDSSPVAHDAAYLFGPKGCGLAELKEISMADLSERPTIRQYNATVVAKRTEQRLARLGRSPNVVIKTSAAMMLELAELGLGYFVMTGCTMGYRSYEMAAVPNGASPGTWDIMP